MKTLILFFLFAFVVAPLGLAQTGQNALPPGLPGASMALSWTDNSQSELGFVIERAPKPATGSALPGAFVEVGRTATDITTWVDKGLPYATGFTYRIRAFNSAGMSDPSGVSTATTATPPVPKPPTNNKAVPVPVPST